MIEKRSDIFLKRRLTFFLMILIIGILFIFSSNVTNFDIVKGILSLPKAFQWIFTNLVPDAGALDKLPKILAKLLETILLSISVTTFAAIGAFFFSLFGSKAIGVNGGISRVVRIIAAFFRNVPDVVWAILLMFSFGQNIVTGFLALFFTTFGMLTRSFIETIDEIGSKSIEALSACGANFLQLVFQGIIPSVIAEIITWILYMIETNIRSSTLIGMLTATGIGYLFDLYYKRMDYSTASMIVLMIIIVVIAIESISNKIRRVIL